MPIFNIYCDESCHLEKNHERVMLLGAIWCPSDKAREVSVRLREIKIKHGLDSRFETKWVKVSPGKQSFYHDVLDYFFDNDDLHFRALIIPDKSKLTHEAFQQDHETFYYKMYFTMLKVLLSPQDKYNIYLDIKDTRGSTRVHELSNILSNNMYDFSRTVVRKIQIVRSEEIELLQVADLLIGAVGYANRGLS